MGCLHHHSLRGYSRLHYSLSRRPSSPKSPKIQDQEVYQSQKKQKINLPFVSIEVNPDPVKEIPLFPHSTPPVPNTMPQSTSRPIPPPHSNPPTLSTSPPTLPHDHPPSSQTNKSHPANPLSAIPRPTSTT